MYIDLKDGEYLTWNPQTEDMEQFKSFDAAKAYAESYGDHGRTFVLHIEGIYGAEL